MFALALDHILARRRGSSPEHPVGAARPPSEAAERRLRDERVLWLSTVDENGFPHLVPIWYVWDGEAFLIFSKPHARKVRAMLRQPRVALAVGEPLDDFDVQLIEGHATVVGESTREVLGDERIGREHARKYAAELFNLGISRDEYEATYSAVVRVAPTRFLPWHGRGPRWSAPEAATAPATA